MLKQGLFFGLFLDVRKLSLEKRIFKRRGTLRTRRDTQRGFMDNYNLDALRWTAEAKAKLNNIP